MTGQQLSDRLDDILTMSKSRARVELKAMLLDMLDRYDDVPDGLREDIEAL